MHFVLCDSKSASIQELGGVIRSKGVERERKPAAKPMQVNHSEPSLHLRDLHRRADPMNAVTWELEEGVAERKKQGWFANLDASKAAGFQKKKVHCRRVCWASRRRRR
jgi:hypothetical protein